VTVVGFYFLSSRLGARDLRQVALFSLLGVPAVIAFVAIMFVTITRFKIWQSLLLGIAGWLLVAGVVVAADALWLHLGKQ
jgi:uncharacterized membrane protein (GlpM family)